VGFKVQLLPKLKPFSTANGSFNSIDEHLVRGADIETDPEMDHMQQQKPPGKSSCPDGRRRKFQSSISETKDVPKNTSKPDYFDKSVSGGKDLSLSQLVTGEVYASRKANVKCIPSGSDDKIFQCSKYSKQNFQDRITTGDSNGKDRDDIGGNQQIKRQRSFDTQQAKN